MFRRKHSLGIGHAIVHGLTTVESALIVAFTLVVVTLCGLDLFWYPRQLWFWAMLGAAGLGCQVVATALDDRQITLSVAQAHRRARQGRLVMHSRSLLHTLLGAAAWRTATATIGAFRGPLAAGRLRELNAWFLETAALANTLDCVAGSCAFAKMLQVRAPELPPQLEREPADLMLRIMALLDATLQHAPRSRFERHSIARIQKALKTAHTAFSASQTDIERVFVTTTGANPTRLELSQLMAEITRQRRILARTNAGLRRAAAAHSILINNDWRRPSSSRARLQAEEAATA